jgi:2'-5' RNA ligase
LVLQKSFKAEIRNVEIFPTAVVANVYSEELIALHKKLFKILPSSQIQYENENYIPHVTV